MRVRPMATRRGISLMDVVISLAILRLLVSLFLPAVLSAQAECRLVLHSTSR